MKHYKPDIFLSVHKKHYKLFGLCEKNSDFNDRFIQLARDVYIVNDKRSKIKLEINKILGSNIKEVKQYTQY